MRGGFSPVSEICVCPDTPNKKARNRGLRSPVCDTKSGEKVAMFRHPKLQHFGVPRGSGKGSKISSKFVKWTPPKTGGF